MPRAAEHYRTPPPGPLLPAQADLLVIGGGIVGASIARDAAMRGLVTVLAEARDLASGTSGISSRLAHGGLRYLEQRAFGLVREALRERATLRRIAPHLVRPLPFVFPLYRGDRVAPWQLGAGLWLYDLLAGGRRLERHRRLDARGLLALEPALRAAGLRGGGRYLDMQCDDARLTVATARDAARHGAAIRTWTRAESLVRDGGRVAGAVLTDARTGARATVRAHAVIAAAGPWTDAVRRLEDPAAAPLLRLTKGAHVLVPRARLGHEAAIAFLSPVDGRVMFVLPWGPWSYIGTTDTDTVETPDDVRAGADDVDYLLRSANSVFPSARLAREDVVSTWAGLRPLVADGAAAASSVSREHLLLEGPGGLVTITGGKLTTCRLMAAQAVDRVLGRIPPREGRPWPRRAPTDVEPLPGGESAELAPIAGLLAELPLGEATIAHLLRCYGTEAAAMGNLVRAHPALAAPLHPEHPAIAAEAVHAARREFARTVADVLVRRIRLADETRDRGAAAAAATAALLGRELGWDDAEAERERLAYLAAAGAAA